MKYVPPEEPVALGEVVVTSGLDRIFPEGLPVGTVASVNREGGGFFQHIEVLRFRMMQRSKRLRSSTGAEP